jgi:branched-chain amino acid transport system substrate-binding protein
MVAFDSKANAQEALMALKQATDQGIRFIVHGISSSVALALTDAVSKHNQRNPDRTVLYLNYASIVPELTNEHCSFWFFRFDADGDMKMVMLGSAISANRNIKKIYLINQDYASGQIYAKAAREMLSRRRPDIAIVGDELHPLGKVKDFAPYIAKIRASGADAVLTNNFGNDLTLLIKAARESGLPVNFYTYYFTLSPGVLALLGESAIGHVKQVSVYDTNGGNERGRAFLDGYRKKYKEDFANIQQSTTIDMLVQAINQARSDDPKAVALALENMTLDHFYGPVKMRADNHQLIQPLFLTSVSKVNGREVNLDWERTGLGWRVEHRIDGQETHLPTICKMDRP